MTLTTAASDGYVTIPANGTTTVPTSGITGLPDNAEVIVARAFAQGWTSPGAIAIADPDDTGDDSAAVSLNYDGDDSNPLTNTVVLRAGIETGGIVLRNTGSSAVRLRLDALGWYEWQDDDVTPDPIDTTPTPSTNDTVQQIMEIEGSGMTAQDVMDMASDIAATANVSTDDALVGILNDVKADATEVSHDSGDDDTTPDTIGAASPTNAKNRIRLHMPKPAHWGDIVYAPNGGKYFSHGHAAIFSNWDYVIHSPGAGGVVEQKRSKAKSFAPGAKMMSIYTDNGNGDLLSLKTRKKAISWARSRRGDVYRNWKRHNTVVVSGKVGTSDNAQNCSQLVWAAYKVAAGYDMNPIQLASYATPATLAADLYWVRPKELEDDSHSKVYRTVDTDYGA